MHCVPRIFSIRCLVAFFVLSVALSSSAAVAAPPALKVCYETWDPYIYPNDNGELRGIAVELLDTALAELGQSAEYTNLPFKRCISEVRSGEADIALPVTAGRDYLQQSETVFAHWTLAAIVPDSSELESPVTLDMLNDFSVIIISGYIYPEKISRWAETHSRLTEVTYSADGAGLVPFRMLEFGRAEVFIEDNYWSANLIETHNLDVHVLEPALDSAVSIAVYRKQLAGLRGDVDQTLKELGQPFRDELFIKYTGHPEAYFSGQSVSAASGN